MARSNYIIRDHDLMHFVTFTVIDWMDIFTRLDYKNCITENLNYCIKNKGLNFHAWCLMTNHIHLIISSNDGKNLADIIRDYKKFTSKAIKQLIKDNPQESRKDWILDRLAYRARQDARSVVYKLWQEGYHGIELTNHDVTMIDQKINYIHQNPVRAGIVEMPEDFLFSSARDYADQKGLVDVALI